MKIKIESEPTMIMQEKRANLLKHSKCKRKMYTIQSRANEQMNENDILKPVGLTITREKPSIFFPRVPLKIPIYVVSLSLSLSFPLFAFHSQCVRIITVCVYVINCVRICAVPCIFCLIFDDETWIYFPNANRKKNHCDLVRSHCV